MTSTDLKTGVVGELGTKAPARVATTANITLEGLQTVNGVILAANDIILVRSQTDTTENGVYISSTSAWERAVWFDDELDALPGTLIFAVEGASNPNTLWQTVCADNPIIFGTSEITFDYFSSTSTKNASEIDNLIETSGQLVSDIDLFQASKSAAVYASCSTSYTSILTGSNYALTSIDNLKSPPALKNYLEIWFRPDITNSGPVTVTLPGLANKPLRKENGVTEFFASELSTSRDYNFRYDLSTNSFILKTLGFANVKLIQNVIINGDFQIAQRETTFTSVANGDYTLDMWKYNKVGAMVHDISQSTDVPTFAQASRYILNSIKIDCTTIDATIGAADVCIIEQVIEGYNFQPIAQKDFTASFWIKATKTGVYGVSFSNSGNDRTYVEEITINASDTWEYKTITIPASPSAGTWNYTTGVGLKFRLCLAAGSNSQGASGSWLAGSAPLTTSNQVNACDSIANNVFLSSVQIEEGVSANSFTSVGYAQALTLCQRYYCSSKSVSSGNLEEFYLLPIGSPTQWQRQTVSFPIVMRAVPSLTQTRTGGDASISAVVENTQTGFRLSIAGAQYTFIEYTWTASAEF